ncbi:MAG: glycosyltransferase family A protein [bacterium]|nr:glycosyltransferase family A protein [bacterium]
MTHPLFTIVIPTFNEEHFLGKLLESLERQSFRDFEVVVSDGGSKDKTVAVARSYQKKLPHLSVLDPKTGEDSSPSRQRNQGATSARGTWLLFIDADSVLLPYALERIAVFTTSGDVTQFTTWFLPDSDVGGDIVLTLLGILLVESSILLKRSMAPGPLTGIARSAFTDVGGYNESIRFAEDYDITQRLERQGNALRILREGLYIYSLRRARKEGRLRFLQIHAKASVYTLFTKKAYRQMPNYILGGHIYTKKPSKKKRFILRKLEIYLKALMKELGE